VGPRGTPVLGDGGSSPRVQVSIDECSPAETRWRRSPPLSGVNAPIDSGEFGYGIPSAPIPLGTMKDQQPIGGK
jgi:hypothetical protein